MLNNADYLLCFRVDATATGIEVGKINFLQYFCSSVSFVFDAIYWSEALTIQ